MSAARDYLQQMAAGMACNVGDLLVLAPANDPFNCGTAGDWAKAKWFADRWSEAGLSTGVHIRRIHYNLLSRGDVLCRDGKPYINTLECWQELNVCSKAARYLQLVPIDAFDDRRNPPPVTFTPQDNERGGLIVEGLLPTIELDFGEIEWPRIKCEPPRHSDDFHVEIWCEKSTMNDVLLPICERRNVNLVTGLGELSITAVDGLMQRMRARNKPCRVLYISDFDPGGQSMPVAVARKAEYMLWTEAEQTGVTRDLRVYPLVMTGAQVKQYALPRVPIKESERRRESFELRHGAGATELDALEALHPGELARILKRALDAYRDPTLYARVALVREQAQERCDAATEEVSASFADELSAAEAELARRLESVRQWEEQYRPLFEKMWDELQAVDVESPDWPSPEYPPEPANALFDSKRTYREQQEAYRAFKSTGVA